MKYMPLSLILYLNNIVSLFTKFINVVKREDCLLYSGSVFNSKFQRHADDKRPIDAFLSVTVIISRLFPVKSSAPRKVTKISPTGNMVALATFPRDVHGMLKGAIRFPVAPRAINIPANIASINI